MYNTVKIRIRQTKQFVRQHPTASACIVTAVITHRVTRNSTLKGVLDETTQLAYKWGQENGVLNMHINTMGAFIDEKGLAEEFFTEFIPSLGKAATE